MATAKKKEVAEMADQLPAHLQKQAGEYRGNEEVTTDDLLIPRLGLLQALSPELDGDDAKFIPGARAGMLFNSLTRELYDSVTAVNVFFRKEYPIFRLRKKGGGYAGTHPTEREANMALLQLDNPDEYEVMETGLHFLLLLDENGGVMGEAALPMTVTKLKVSRQWNSLIRMRGGDRYAGTWTLSGVKEKNSAGDSYHNFAVKMGPWTTEEQYAAAEEAYNAVVAGERKVDQEKGDKPAESDEY